MTTNILATITFLLTTNVTEEFSDYARWEPETQPWPNQIIGFGNQRTKGVDPQTKYVTTTIKKLTMLSFDWAGVRQVVAEEVLGVETDTFTRGWIQLTNDIRVQILTNIISPEYERWLRTPGGMTNIIWHGTPITNPTNDIWITNHIGMPWPTNEEVWITTVITNMDVASSTNRARTNRPAPQKLRTVPMIEKP